MVVPDQSHMDRIRAALWQRSGGASVMVGSGFSRNALNARPDADAPPTWRELTREIFDRLYPPSHGECREARTAEASASEGFPKLAQEYEAAFGRSDLHRLLQNTVRDDDFAPGDMHRRLLRLPWCDVFTTNWDTLLERTRTLVAEQKYGVVRNKDEIPLAGRPRIVKLHGSFPAHFPLIFTEEDYRAYPNKFAPFVNTVQQAMMETVFCLIGFSGDDPNFLHWSGWVRDNLGDSAPKIYLAGWLGLLPHRRRMLEDRNVVPVDLALHPKATSWPEHLRHEHATDWILHTLERGRPYDVTDWPSPRTWQHAPIPEDLQPVVQATSDEPRAESGSTPELEAEDLLDRVKKTLDIWSHNRKLYPGWLAAPASARSLIHHHTDEWEPLILAVLPKLAPLHQLHAMHELVWRREIVLDPVSDQLDQAAEQILQSVDCQARTVNGNAGNGIDWSDVREAWRSIAQALVTVARHNFDREMFEQRIDALSPFRHDEPDLTQRIHHERCLWAIYSMDFPALENLLRDWRTDDCDPAWTLRKVSLLVETNRIEDAVELFNHALSTIRRMPNDAHSVAGPSREGWALWQALALESRFYGEQVDNRPDTSPFFRRWRELAPLKCDALSEKQEYINAMGEDRKNRDAPIFDLGIRRIPGIRFSNARHRHWVSAHRAIRLSEVAGLPVSRSTFGVASDVLENAAEVLSPVEQEMAVRLTLRVLSYNKDPILGRILSRTRMARMSADLAKILAGLCEDLMNYALSEISGVRTRPGCWVERLRVSMEALSRLLVRLDPDTVETIFDKAVEYYKNAHIARHPWLADPVDSLLRRSWEVLPENRRGGRVLDLLSAPIVGVEGFTNSMARYPEPGHLVIQDDLPPPDRNDESENRWQDVVRLLTRALREGGESRQRASIRIARVALWDRMTQEETNQVANALWDERQASDDGLPEQTWLYDWVFLLLPELESGIAERRFRRKWLAPRERSPDPDEILWQVGIAIRDLKNHGYSFDLSGDEISYLTSVIEQWSKASIPDRYFHPIAHQFRQPIQQAIVGLHTIISELKLRETTAEGLYTKGRALNDAGIPAFSLFAGLVKALPKRLDDIVLLMKMGLASDRGDLARNAAFGLHSWLKASNGEDLQIPSPPDDLVRELGVVIATRRKESLDEALQVAKWVFDEGKESHRDLLCQLVLHGLGYLVEELRYDRDHDEHDDDVPSLRWRSAQLAVSLSRYGFEKHPTVVRWIQTIQNDPLPEVRYTEDSLFAHPPVEVSESDAASRSTAR